VFGHVNPSLFSAAGGGTTFVSEIDRPGVAFFASLAGFFEGAG
jgi:hypothetical protein